MKSISYVLTVIASILQFVSAQVRYPSNSDSWRIIPIMPNVFLEDTTKYALFAENDVMYITF